jgi:hypothetical protein
MVSIDGTTKRTRSSRTKEHVDHNEDDEHCDGVKIEDTEGTTRIILYISKALVVTPVQS